MTGVLAEVCAWFGELLQEPCGADDRLFSTGRLDSAQLMTAVAWARDRFGVDVGPEDLALANFDTPGRFADFLQRQR